jgi:hypothetical protein
MGITNTSNAHHSAETFTSTLTKILSYYNGFDEVNRLIQQKTIDFREDYVMESYISQLADIKHNISILRDEFSTFVRSYLVVNSLGQDWGSTNSALRLAENEIKASKAALRFPGMERRKQWYDLCRRKGIIYAGRTSDEINIIIAEYRNLTIFYAPADVKVTTEWTILFDDFLHHPCAQSPKVVADGAFTKYSGGASQRPVVYLYGHSRGQQLLPTTKCAVN